MAWQVCGGDVAIILKVVHLFQWHLYPETLLLLQVRRSSESDKAVKETIEGYILSSCACDAPQLRLSIHSRSFGRSSLRRPWPSQCSDISSHGHCSANSPAEFGYSANRTQSAGYCRLVYRHLQSVWEAGPILSCTVIVVYCYEFKASGRWISIINQSTVHRCCTHSREAGHGRLTRAGRVESN